MYINSNIIPCQYFFYTISVIAHKADCYNYNAKAADRMYRERLTDARAGINMTKKELLELDAVGKPLNWQGQSPYMIIANHPELNISVKTLYNYIDQGVLLTRNSDLKRKVKFKPRKCHKIQITDRSVFIGCTYKDFIAKRACKKHRCINIGTQNSKKAIDATVIQLAIENQHLY